ncbi:hypothetical protein BC939DRAFT_526374 [Gamsiella multidivaricata]|uniref:uncharacterized protein n=1 Tax=Gamsiella multidivaricata TaxID=101098 RepID=UPI00221EF198|nr:uncharacterized protein BC939DRAFT_526374 [Gamsiella multidivaricata]KAG0349720.1 hypothetical protein BGZ54_004242 [Gamsiella multidivaricata]KAI7828922.1 hypothetical protein BC939DRAFT_526374 [Gamsiella multidivaricata]
MSTLLRIPGLSARSSLSRTILGSGHCRPLSSTLPFRNRTWATNAFSTSSPASYSLEKKSLSKKITIPKDPYLLSEKVVKFAKNGKLDDAITLVLEAPKSRQNEIVWNHLIQESSKLGKTNQSWQLLSDMKKRGFEPSDRTYTILLNALAINTSSPNSVSRAKALYQQMQDSEDTLPTATHTNALLKVCAYKPDYESLQEVYEGMPKSGPSAPDVVTFSILINSFARMGGDKGFEMAWKIWEDCLEAKTRRPDEIEIDQALVDAVLLACRQARSSSFIKRGYRLVESLYGLSLTSSGSAGSDRTSATDRTISPGKALGLGTILRGDTIQPRTVELLVSISAKLKEYRKAEDIMELIRTNYPDFRPDSQLLASLMHLHISTKEYKKAIQKWDEINIFGLQHTPATFKQGLDAALKIRSWDKTLEMYTEMRNQIRQNKSIDTNYRRPVNPLVDHQDAWTLASTLKCAVKTKHIPEAVQILQETRWTNVVRNTRYPRANADVAELAVKIYTGALKATNSNKATTSSTDRDERWQLGEEELEKELQTARDLHTRLVQTLARYDEEKAKRETEDKEASRNRRVQRPPSVSSTKEEEPGSSWRELGKDEGSDGYRGQRNSGNGANRRGHRDGRSKERGGFEAAFRPSKSFSREVY